MNLKILALDVDGVLTDGGIYMSSAGGELLRFHVLDGVGIKRWMEAGGECVWVTARSSPAVLARAKNLGVDHVLVDVDDKVRAMEEFLERLGYCWENVVYIGDDIVDLDPVRLSGFGVAVETAVSELKRAADFVTHTPGGQGAVREVVDRILAEDLPR